MAVGGEGRDRRSFLKLSAFGAVSAALFPGEVSGARELFTGVGIGSSGADLRPIRIRGRVVMPGGQGVGRIPVSDGLQVIDTEADGRFTLITHSGRPFVYLSVPSGFRIPRNPLGTARFYERIRDRGDGEMDVLFTLSPLAGSDEHHRMLLLADPQTQTAEEMEFLHAQTVPDVQELLRRGPEVETFGIGCGDLMFDDLDLFPGWERAVDRMGVPFFQVVGNHDIVFHDHGNAGTTDTFSEHFGPEHYSFDRGAVHYVVLNDVLWHGTGYIGYVSPEQLAWLEADLARVEPGRTVLVALHIPLMQTGHTRLGQDSPSLAGTVQNRAALYRLLEPYQAHIVSGHTHQQEHIFEGGVHEHIHGTVCGAWWSGPICRDGTPNGYGVYEARGEELRWQYKSTGYALDHQLRAYLPENDPDQEGRITANVWNWDPSWTVVVHEGSDRRGAMEPRILSDPLSIRIHTGSDQPPRRTWVNPFPTGHMFVTAMELDPARTTVEAVDPWGRSYAARPESMESIEAWAWARFPGQASPPADRPQLFRHQPPEDRRALLNV